MREGYGGQKIINKMPNKYISKEGKGRKKKRIYSIKSKMRNEITSWIRFGSCA